MYTLLCRQHQATTWKIQTCVFIGFWKLLILSWKAAVAFPWEFKKVDSIENNLTLKLFASHDKNPNMLVNKKYTIHFESRNVQLNLHSGVGLPTPCLSQLVDGLIFVRIIWPTLLALQVGRVPRSRRAAWCLGCFAWSPCWSGHWSSCHWFGQSTLGLGLWGLIRPDLLLCSLGPSNIQHK